MKHPLRQITRRPRTALIGLALCTAAGSAAAGVIRDDVSESLYTGLANQPKYDAVGQLTVAGLGSCSGNLINARWVLTAAHCVDSPAISGATFQVAGNSYSASQWFAHQNWNGNVFAGNDIGLVKLAAPVTGVSFAKLYGGAAPFFQVGTYVGFGARGTGDVGYTLPGGVKIAGQNVIDTTVTGSNPAILVSDFDNPHTSADNFPGTSPVALPLEYILAPGDSGGGMFIDIAGMTYLAGINSFLAWVDGVGDADYGDLSGATPVSAFIDWIDAHVVPAPGSLLLLAPGLLLARRRAAA